MPQSSHRDDFFQTDASIADSDRKATKSQNEHGKPIRLQSKILAAAVDPFSTQSIFVAESAGTVRKVALETGGTLALYRGPTAPVTSLAFSPDGNLLFAGCWDKTIWSWDVRSRQPQQKYEGHSDFVKAVVCARIGGHDILISGGADSKIIAFDITSGERLHALKDHLRGIQDLCIDPASLEQNNESIKLFSAGSEREIREYTISTKTVQVEEPIIVHETSVYKLYFDDDGDLWTASADKSTKCLTRDSGWKPNFTVEHPDFVRDVVISEQGGWVITACRDEEVRVWNKATGDLYHTFTGHFEEVTGLLLIENLLVSVSIDATIRQWSLKPADLQKAIEEAKKEDKEEEKPKQESMLTEEEERELAELMDNDDDDE